jgi:signal transduction histidine kinase
MSLGVIQKTVFGVLLVAVLLLSAIGTTGYLAYRLADLDYWTIHTHQVIEQLLYSLKSLEDAETGVRGYLITHDQRFLQPYRASKDKVLQYIDQVQRLTTDNSVQQLNVAVLKQDANEKLQACLIEQNLEAKGNSDAALKQVISDKDKRLMDTFRDQCAKMIDAESKLLDERSTALADTQTAIWFATGGLSLVAISVLAWIANMTRNTILLEQKRVSELGSLNAGMRTEIEQRIKTEAALKEATAKLTSSNTDLQQFAYVASHDLQEPLRAVAGFLTLLSNKHKDEFDPESKQWIGYAVDGAHRMRNLINDLLLYARVDSRGRELVATDCQLTVDMAKKNLAILIGETEAEVTCDKLPTVLADEGQLVLLFQNLIANAIKFRSNRKPQVRITTEQSDVDWTISVSDNGLGFDMQHAERIFVIFQRLQTRDKAEGTGIGLALCKKIVERHRGRIWATSAVDQGSTFSFTLPRVEIIR